jgi:protein-tyrosine phosphatase
MIDIHSHIIYGVDDGSPSIQESLRMILEAERLGFDTVIATPHLQGGLAFLKKVTANFMDLKKRVEGCGIRLLLGYEVMITPNLPLALFLNKNITLDKTMYLLLELPHDSIPIYCQDVLYQLRLQGTVPILAHPERNVCFANNTDEFSKFTENGCLVQMDAGSILGDYGRTAKSFAKKLIRENKVNFIASDAHRPQDYTDRYPQAFNTVVSWAGEEYAKKLFSENPNIIFQAKNEQ